jgi:EamA domain-containing membrane protein RarD
VDGQLHHDRRIRAGLVYGLIAYGWWGFVAVYFKLLAQRSVPVSYTHLTLPTKA